MYEGKSTHCVELDNFRAIYFSFIKFELTTCIKPSSQTF
jgi:hypothetical protein